LVFRKTDEPCNQPISELAGIRLRHFPVRSLEQLAIKVGLGRLGRELLGGYQATGGVHWDQIWLAISSGNGDLGTLQHATREYLDTGRFRAEQLSDTPIALEPMAAHFDMRIANLPVSAAVVILKWANALVARVAASSGRDEAGQRRA